jgi:steroid 5-alpha reductase family enzyme
VTSNSASLARVAFAYVVAFAAAAVWLAWGPETDWRWLDTVIADALATLVIFGFSRAHSNSSFYDAYWSVVPPAVAIFWWASSDLPVGDVRAWLAVGVTTLWAIRLTGNWVYGWPGLHHEDWRYPMLRDKAGRDVGAVALEFVADRQLHRFVRARRPGQVMDHGVWSWSRHPNYFGEISFWVSLVLFGVAASPHDAWWLFAGSLAMLAMFLGASIPMMEERSLERRPSYQDVIERVPMLVPRPPRGSRRPQQSTA